MLTERFLLRWLPAFIVTALAIAYGADRVVVGQPTAGPFPTRSLLIQTSTVRVEQASTPESRVQQTKPAHRPVDSTLLHDLSVSSDGAIWIAPLFNGIQWGGVYERMIRFDPRSKVTSIYKIARMRPEPVAVIPADTGSAWVLDRSGMVGRFSSDGAQTQTVAPEVGAKPNSATTDRNGDLWLAEPARTALGRIDSRTGIWSEIGLSPRIGAIGNLTVDPGGNVWFVETERSRIGRYSPATHLLKVVPLPAPTGNLIRTASSDDGHGIWFIDDAGEVGYLASSTGRTTTWALPERAATSMAPVAGGALLLVAGKLVELDRASGRFVRLALPAGFIPSNLASDMLGGAWIAGETGVAHLDARAVRATMYSIRGIDASTPMVAGRDGRVCLLVNDAAACLAPTSVLTIYRSQFVPGVIGTAAGKHSIWFSERGRLTRVDEATHIRDFAYLADAFGPADLAVAPDGTMWAAGHGAVERFSTSGVGMSIRVGEPGAGPFGITVDATGRLWFAMNHAVGVIRVEHDKATVTTYDLGSDSSPEDIVVDSDGTAWCTDAGGAILHVGADGRTHRFALPSANAEPFGITIGPDNAVWFTEFYNDSVGRLDPSTGAVVEYPLRSPHRFPTSIVMADGALWFLDLSGFLGRISTRGEVTEISVPTPSP